MNESTNEKFRSLVFGAEDTGAYVQVFQRPGERVLMECNFFGPGNKTIDEAQGLQHMLTNALAQARAWALETNPEFSGKFCQSCRSPLMKADLDKPSCPYCGVT